MSEPNSQGPFLSVLRGQSDDEAIQLQMMERYFAGVCPHPSSYPVGVTDQLHMELLSGSLSIAATSTPIQKSVQPTVELPEQLLERIQSEKQAVLSKLHQIYEEERQLILRKERRSTSEQRQYHKPREEQRLKLIEAIEKKRLFDAAVEQKTKASLRRMMEQQEQERQREMERREELKQVKKEKAEQHLKHMKERRLKAEKFLEEMRVAENKIRQYRYAHLVNAEKAEEELSREEQQRQIKLEAIKLTASLNGRHEIQEHIREYDQALLRRRESTPELKPVITERYHQTHFSQLARETLEKARNQQLARHQESLQARNKVKEYTGYVLEKFKPKSTTHFSQQKREEVKAVMDFREQREKGVEYLHVAKKLKKFKDLQEQASKKEMPVAQIHKYRDYLKEMPRHSIESLGIGESEGLQQGKILAQKLEIKSKKVGDSRLVESVRSKLELLSKFIPQ